MVFTIMEREMRKLIYIADDEDNIRKLILAVLKEENDVIAFETGDELLETFKKVEPDLVILDVMMPGKDGFEISEEIRAISKVPIILLTARDTSLDFEKGINLGADDYITKPFKLNVLVMKVKALLRRVELDTESDSSGILSFEDIRIDLNKKTVYIKGKEIELAPNEYNLLTYLLKNKDRAVSREELLDKVWGYNTLVETRVTDDTLKRLRKKIIDSNVSILTVWGFGFRVKKKS